MGVFDDLGDFARNVSNKAVGAANLGKISVNIKLEQSKIEEIRLVDRAKCMLIQYLSMTESQAHRYIEKQAMDRRVTRGEVARSILGLYDP